MDLFTFAPPIPSCLQKCAHHTMTWACSLFTATLYLFTRSSVKLKHLGLLSFYTCVPSFNFYEFFFLPSTLFSLFKKVDLSDLALLQSIQTCMVYQSLMLTIYLSYFVSNYTSLDSNIIKKTFQPLSRGHHQLLHDLKVIKYWYGDAINILCCLWAIVGVASYCKQMEGSYYLCSCHTCSSLCALPLNNISGGFFHCYQWP